MPDEDGRYTQEEVDELIAERNEALEANRDEILGELKEAKSRLRKYSGIDPDEHDKLRKEVERLEREKRAAEEGLSKEKMESLSAEIRAQVEQEYEEKLARMKELEQENRTIRLHDRVKDKMGEAGVRSDRISDLYKLTEEHFDLSEDGEPIQTAKPGKEVDKFIAEDLSKEYPEFYNGSGSSGGGASKSAGSAGGTAKIAAGDNDAFLSNLEGIARGEVTVEGE